MDLYQIFTSILLILLAIGLWHIDRKQTRLMKKLDAIAKMILDLKFR